MDETEEELLARIRRAETSVAARKLRLAQALASGDFASLTESLDLSALAWQLARSGAWDKAEEVARSIADDPDERDEALALIAQCLADAGEAARAESLAVSLPSDPDRHDVLHEKCEALTRVARAFAGLGAVPQARQALANALEATAILEPISLWEAPSCLVDIAKVYRAIGDIGDARNVLHAAITSAMQHTDTDCTKIIRRARKELEELGQHVRSDA